MLCGVYSVFSLSETTDQQPDELITYDCFRETGERDGGDATRCFSSV